MVIGYLAVVNLLLFIMMGVDKYKAKTHQWRISERLLQTLGILGGGLGGLLAQRIFHHKTRKPVFYVIFSIGVLFSGWLLVTQG